MTPTQQQTLARLSDGPACPVRIGQEIGVSTWAAMFALNELRRSGRVALHGGEYRLAAGENGGLKHG